jgi:hypothetical protein
MKEFREPDLSAPRFRPEVYSILNKTFFDSFRNKFPKYKDLENKDLKNIIKSFNEYLYNTVIETRDGVQLPESIGWIFIGTCQTSKKENVDYAKSKKYGVAVSNKNWDTDGKLAKIFFTNYALKHKMKNREFWSFIACRDFKRKVSKAYPENWNMYVVVNPTKKLQLEHKRLAYKEVIISKTRRELQTYKDFDL